MLPDGDPGNTAARCASILDMSKRDVPGSFVVDRPAAYVIGTINLATDFPDSLFAHRRGGSKVIPSLASSVQFAAPSAFMPAGPWEISLCTVGSALAASSICFYRAKLTFPFKVPWHTF